MSTNGHDWIAQHPELAAIIPVARKAQPKGTTKPPPKREPLPMPVREGDVVTLYLALPPAQLRSNGRAHHMVKAKLVKDCREVAGLLAKIVAPPKPWERARIDVESWSARKQDPTNFWHGLKAYIDGCEDGGLFVTDADVEQGKVVQHIDGKRDGKRQVTLTITRTA